MGLFVATIVFPPSIPHFTFLGDAASIELMALRWLHFIFGIIWIGLLYFFNLVGTPALTRLDPPVRVKVYPELMSRAMAWFRWSALITVLVGLRYFYIYLTQDGGGLGPHRAFHWFMEWLVVWLVAYGLLYGLQLPGKGTVLDISWVRALAIAVVV